MRVLYLFLLSALLHLGASAQTINVSGQCISGTPVLNKTADDVDGKPAYEGTGTVDGNDNVAISIFWMEVENVWVLAFDGQPYYSTDCDQPAPPGTSFATCTWETVDGTSCTGGAALVIDGSGTLPVRFISFTATPAGAGIELEWKTASETNNKGFEVQRSKNGSQWAKLGFLGGAGNSAAEKRYRFTDAAPQQGKNYYRLVQYDTDGPTAYSTVVTADFAVKRFYTLQQTGNGRYQLAVTSEAPVEYAVMDLSGRKLFGKTLTQGVHAVDLSAYAKGVYLLQVKQAAQYVTEKLIKQ